MPRVSVIVPTRNRSNLLARTLEGLTRQDADPDEFEVIVVDNGSTDDTSQVCTDFNAMIPDLHVRYDDRPGLHIGRHVGLEASSADIALFGDDDIVPDVGWVRAVSEGFSDEAVGLVGGPCRPDYAVTPPEWVDELRVSAATGWFIPEFSVIDLGGVTQPIAPEMVFGCNFGVRRHLIEEVGGFHPDALPSELLRFRGDGEVPVARGVVAAGYSAVYVPGAAVAHHVSAERLRIEYIEQRAFAEGVTDSYRRIRSTGRPDRSLEARLRTARGSLRAARSSSVVVRRKWVAKGRGYRWHQSLARSSEDLRSWIKTPTYYGEAGDLAAKFAGLHEKLERP